LGHLPTTPRGIFREINRLYYERSLPEPRFIWVEDGGEVPELDARNESAAINRLEDGSYVLAINRALADFTNLLYFSIGHECIHLKIGLEKEHGSKEWNAETRRLQGLGFFLRCF
jgi:hypothetical protein